MSLQIKIYIVYSLHVVAIRSFFGSSTHGPWHQDREACTSTTLQGEVVWPIEWLMCILLSLSSLVIELGQPFLSGVHLRHWCVNSSFEITLLVIMTLFEGPLVECTTLHVSNIVPDRVVAMIQHLTKEFEYHDDITIMSLTQ